MLAITLFAIFNPGFVLCALEAGDMILNPVIVGGTRARISEAPFMAIYVTELKTYLSDEDKFSPCGASILSDRFILSAAHCYIKKEERERQYVIVGTDIMGKGQSFGIKNVILHPMYNNTAYDYDVLVINLVGKLQFSDKIQPIRMADSNLVLKEGVSLKTFGFGRTELGSTQYLLKVRIPYISQKRCKVAYKELTERMICAGEKGKDSCYGDSGGPLVYGKVLVGVVSFGNDCGDPAYPGVYASVLKLREFIDDVIKRYS